MFRAKSVSATFIPVANLHDLTIAVDPVGGGTTTPSVGVHSYAEGSIISVTAAPAAGYVFDHWSGACTGSGACLVTMDADKSVTAHFVPITYDLTLAKDPAGGGKTTPSAGVRSYAEESIVAVTATPATGYRFDHWSGGCTGSGSCSVTMDADKTVTAVFAINMFTLTVTQSTGGTITPPTATYDWGTVVDLTATPALGYNFVQWTGAYTGSGSCSVTMDADKSVSATFAINTFTLSYTAGANGSLTGDTLQTVSYGGSGTPVTAVPNTGYHFVNWSDGSTANPRTDTNVTTNVTVTANFALLSPVTLTISPTTGGTITAVPAGPYNQGDEVTLTATAEPGYNFFYWTGDTSGTISPVIITLDGNKTVGAYFQLGMLREKFDSLTGWTSKGKASMTLDSGNYREGAASIKITMPVKEGYGYLTRTVYWDLSASDERGRLRFWVYQSDTGTPTSL